MAKEIKEKCENKAGGHLWNWDKKKEDGFVLDVKKKKSK